MPDPKSTYESKDATPVVLYAKRTAADEAAYALLEDGNGNLFSTSGISLPVYDYVARVLTNSTTETWTFNTGGAGGTTVATIVIVYTDATLATVSTVTKT